MNSSKETSSSVRMEEEVKKITKIHKQNKINKDDIQKLIIIIKNIDKMSEMSEMKNFQAGSKCHTIEYFFTFSEIWDRYKLGNFENLWKISFEDMIDL